jgi:hypothetical protein
VEWALLLCLQIGSVTSSRLRNIEAQGNFCSTASPTRRQQDSPGARVASTLWEGFVWRTAVGAHGIDEWSTVHRGPRPIISPWLRSPPAVSRHLYAVAHRRHRPPSLKPILCPAERKERRWSTRTVWSAWSAYSFPAAVNRCGKRNPPREMGAWQAAVDVRVTPHNSPML